MTTVAIHNGPAGFHDKWSEFLQARGCDVRRVDFLAADAIEQVRSCDGVMWHWYHDSDHAQSAKPILHVLEHYLNKPVFPSTKTCWHFDNKIAQHYMFKAVDLPTPETNLFWRKSEALAWAETAPFPQVHKLSTGAGSSNVTLVRDKRAAHRIIQTMFSRSGHITQHVSPSGHLMNHLRQLGRRVLATPAYLLAGRYPPLHRQFWQPQKNYALFQEFLPGNEHDTRVTIIGDRAFGYRRMNRDNDFRASGSGDFDTNPDAIDKRCIPLAFDAAAKLEAQTLAFDMLFKNDRPVIVEASYGYVDWMVHDCPGYWTSALDWHAQPMWPEEAHVIDFLNSIA